MYTQAQVQELINAIGAKTMGKLEALRADSDEMHGQLTAIEKAVAKAAALPGGGHDGEGIRSRGPFNSLGEFAQSVARAAKVGGRVDEKLLKVQASAAGAGESIPADGGWLVQKDLAAMLLMNLYKTGVLVSRCNHIPITASSNGVKLPTPNETSRANGSRWGGVQTFWANEAATVTKSKPTYRLLEMTLHKLFGLSYVTDELLEDVPALSAFLNQAFTSEMGFKIDDGIINGPGAGQPLGILSSGALVTVDKESGQRANTVVFENICKMYARLLPTCDATAVWLINRNVVPQLYQMSLSVGTGGVPVYLPAGGAAYQPLSTLFGKPVLVIEQAATLGTVGDILLADLSCYLLADKGGIEAESSIHVQFLTDEMTLRWTYRMDAQPLLAQPITPFKGSDTLSCFVALATRS